MADAPDAPDLSKYWPPQMPAYVSVEALAGPRFGQTTTMFPAFGGTAASPDLGNTRLGSLAGEGGSFGGHVRGELRIPIFAPTLGVDFNFRGAAKEPLAFKADGHVIDPGGIREVLPSSHIGLSGSVLGLALGYRNLGFASGLPGLAGERSANAAMTGFGLGIGLGRVEAAGSLAAGFGWVADGGTAVVLPGELEGHLGLAVWGLKATLGVRGEALAFGGDVANLLRVLRPANLLAAADARDSAAIDPDKARLARELGRLSYTWGPYFQLGVAF